MLKIKCTPAITSIYNGKSSHVEINDTSSRRGIKIDRDQLP